MFKHTPEKDPLLSLGEGQAGQPEEQGALMAGLHPGGVITYCGEDWHTGLQRKAQKGGN